MAAAALLAALLIFFFTFSDTLTHSLPVSGSLFPLLAIVLGFGLAGFLGLFGVAISSHPRGGKCWTDASPFDTDLDKLGVAAF